MELISYLLVQRFKHVFTGSNYSTFKDVLVVQVGNVK